MLDPPEEPFHVAHHVMRGPGTKQCVIGRYEGQSSFKALACGLLISGLCHGMGRVAHSRSSQWGNQLLRCLEPAVRPPEWKYTSTGQASGDFVSGKYTSAL